MKVKMIIRNLEKKYAIKTLDEEDKSVINFLDQIKTEGKKLLEVGSGRGRFVSKINIKYPELKIECLDINLQMVKKTRKLGFKTYHSDFLSENLNSKYDLIHASHIIEHFTYLEACDFLDKCLLVLNKKGYLIIRSPLMNYHFYDDMSHIKPYPPHAVMNYFLLDQQSKQSQNKVKQISVNYRRESLVSKSSGKIGVVIGILFKVLYLSLNIKSLRPNGYILILQKIK